MKCLSLWQPWATLMAIGCKSYETRHWSTKYRGPIAIHAARRRDLVEERAVIDSIVGDWTMHGAAVDLEPFKKVFLEELPRGAIVAIGDLVGCWRTEELASRILGLECACGNYAPGRFAWQIANIKPLRQPLPTMGRQGLFSLPSHVEAAALELAGPIA